MRFLYIVLSTCYLLLISQSVFAAPAPIMPYTVLPPIGKGHRKIGKLSLLKNKGKHSVFQNMSWTYAIFIVRADIFSSLLYKSLLIDKEHSYITSRSLWSFKQTKSLPNILTFKKRSSKIHRNNFNLLISQPFKTIEKTLNGIYERSWYHP